MKKKIRIVLIAVLALVFLVSMAMLLTQRREQREVADIYNRAQQIAAGESVKPEPAGPENPAQSEQPSEDNRQPEPSAKPSDTPGSVLHSIDTAALQAINRHVIGWISIPGTGLSYPLVQGSDNEYYLDHAWDGTPTPAGSIFMEAGCAADFTDFNTIVYGHRMTYDAMFAFLKYYKSQAYWQEHPLVYIRDGEQTRCYRIFAAYEAPIRSPVYWLKVTDENHKQTVIDFALEQSVIDTGIIPQPAQRILTLSTCTGDGHETRWVVQAVEVLP